MINEPSQGIPLFKQIEELFDRVNKIESYLYKFEEQIKMTDAWVSTIKANMITHECFEFNANNIHKRIDEVESELGTVRALGSREFPRKRPYVCPLCQGTGNISTPETIGFDARMGTSEIGISACHSCERKGIVWG